jgi:iron complex transport system substrate-binding protein
LTRFPKRTVILFSSALDLWYLAGGTAVGRVQSSTNVPEAAREIEIVGSMSQPNLEKLVALHPDLVVLFPMMSRQRDLKELLDQQGVENVFIEYTNYHEFLAVLDLFARLNHPRPEEADRLIRSISERVEAVVDRCPKDRHPRVLMLFATARGMQVELPGSHIGTIVEMLGGRNVIDDVRVAPGVTRVEYALERIYQKDPDLILVTVNQDVGNQGEGLAGQLRADAAWGNLRAVREGNVHVLPERFFLYKPNGQFPQAFQHVAAILYPQAAQP